MTAIEEKTTLQQHRRDVLNSVIDLLESLPDRQQQTDVIISAAAAVGVNLTPPKAPARSGYAPRRKYTRG